MSIGGYKVKTSSFQCEKDNLEEKKITKARKKAISEYINNTLCYLNKREKELKKYDDFNMEIIQEKINSLLNEITEKEIQISIATIKNKELSKEIYKLQDKWAECNMLSERYATLRSQYVSDIKRLTFIVEGEVNSMDLSSSTNCPICHGTLPKIKEHSFIEASKVELKKIFLKIKDLDNAENDLNEELENLKKQGEKLMKERKEIEHLINSQLKPQISKMLQEYKESIEINKETSLIKDFQNNMIKDLEKLDKILKL